MLNQYSDFFCIATQNLGSGLYNACNFKAQSDGVNILLICNVLYKKQITTYTHPAHSDQKLSHFLQPNFLLDMWIWKYIEI